MSSTVPCQLLFVHHLPPGPLLLGNLKAKKLVGDKEKAEISTVTKYYDGFLEEEELAEALPINFCSIRTELHEFDCLPDPCVTHDPVDMAAVTRVRMDTVWFSVQWGPRGSRGPLLGSGPRGPRHGPIIGFGP